MQTVHKLTSWLYNYILQAIFFQKYSVQSDVWSFGCVMYEIWSLGHKPFEDLSGKEVNNNTCMLHRCFIGLS